MSNNPYAKYKWPESDGVNSRPNTLKYFHDNPRRCRIGVPQGGAHSCLIANLVLDLADKEVCLSLHSNDEESLYLRYCDDIIIIALSEDACRKATSSYYSSLKAVKLPYHLPTELTGSPIQFFESSKTKECYRWGVKSADPLQFPWIQFLGYQIRFDGRFRVRPSSIKKQREKIEQLSESLRHKIVSKKMKVSKRSISCRFNCKLWAFSSGRVQLGRKYSEPLPMCWASGFRQLAKRRFHPRHIRYLDQVAGRERRRLVKALKKQNLLKIKMKKKVPKNQLRYFGRPFSHLHQFRSE